MSMIFNRREFLRRSALAGIGITFIPNLLRAASDQVRVAHIGLGGMGNNHMNWFAKLPNVEIVGLCDLDSDHLASTLKSLQTLKPDAKPETYADFRRVLERKDI